MYKCPVATIRFASWWKKMAGAGALDFPTASLPSWQTVPSPLMHPLLTAHQSDTCTTVLGVSSGFYSEGRAVKN